MTVSGLAIPVDNVLALPLTLYLYNSSIELSTFDSLPAWILATFSDLLVQYMVTISERFL